MTPNPPDEPVEPAPAFGDRYEVLRVLGAGASARTLLCSDRENGRHVAVKELHFEHLEDWRHLELFEREAKVLSMLEHPGIPRVFEFFQGEGETPEFYIVQEFIEGASLKQRMESGPMLGQQEVYDFALSLLDVLEYMHGRTPPVLHRDIKPSNLLIRPDGQAALVDFGGVCFGWRPPSVAGTTVVGTFGYMPPEQLLGQSGPTSDLYALGATLLHLATGQPPHEFPFDTGRIEVPKNLPIQKPLVRLIEALLRPAPRDRPQTAGAARKILIEEAPAPANDGSRSASVAVAAPLRRNVIIAAEEGPRFVEMGDAPRDPTGEFQDVYRNLMNPLFPARLMWSDLEQALAILLYGFGSLATIGILPLVYLANVNTRKKRFEHVFRDGRFTRGTIIAARRKDMYATFRFEFEASGTLYVASMDYAKEMTRYWDAGDTVPVLYDPEDPTRACFVYR